MNKHYRVVLIEKGPFVVWGSMDTRSFPELMYKQNLAASANNSVLLRSGEVLGGGTTVNVDLAFSPLEYQVFAHIQEWVKEKRIDERYYTLESLAASYQWVRDTIHTRELSQGELNQDNLVLWDGAKALGVEPSLYHLNRFPVGQSPSPVSDKRDAARQLLLNVIEDKTNPLSVIPDAQVGEIYFDAQDPDFRATGVSLTMRQPWVAQGNTIVDPCKLGLPPGVTVKIEAQNIVLAAGTIGTSRLLLRTAAKVPEIRNSNIGRGLVLHPSMPLIGIFDRDINLLEGLDSASYLDSFGLAPGFVFETLTGLPSYGAALIPGSGQQVYDQIVKFNNTAGFGVMLLDTPSEGNNIQLDGDDVVINYQLSETDAARFRIGVAVAIRVLFLAGAKGVIIPSNENYLGQDRFDPTQVTFISDPEQADLVERNLKFTPNRTRLTAAHLQAANKIGSSPDQSVVSTRQRVWNTKTGREIPNLYVMDSSIFPTSVGSNPMQSIYTFAKIFSDRLLHGIDTESPPPARMRTAKEFFGDQRTPVVRPRK
jgi:hypothetical protein